MASLNLKSIKKIYPHSGGEKKPRKKVGASEKKTNLQITEKGVFDHPANLFVAGFIGMPQMNFFNAELVKKDGTYAVSVGGITVELSEEKQKNLSAKGVEPQAVTLGVRPNHINLGASANALRAKVDVSEMMGSEIHLHANADGRDIVIIVPALDLAESGHQSFPAGEEIQFSFGGNVCHVFNQEGKNLEY